MFELFAGVLKEGLILWNSKEARKYLDKVIGLEKDFYNELAKPEGSRSQLYLDKCMRELETIGKNFLRYGPSATKQAEQAKGT